LYELIEKYILEDDFDKIKETIKKTENYKELNYNKKLLVSAIQNSSNKDLIQFFIDNEENLNYENISGKTPLFEALNKHNYYIADKILEKGADINYVNSKNYNVLLYLKNSDDKPFNSQLIDYLVKKKVDINWKNWKGKTFIDCLIEDGNLKMIELFLNNIIFKNDLIISFILYGKNKFQISNDALNSIIKTENEKILINLNTIDTIIKENNIEMLNLILKYKFFTSDDELLVSALQSSCKLKNIDILKILIEKGVNVNCKEKDTLITPLINLTIFEKKLNIKNMNERVYEMFELLINAGADVNAKDAQGKTVLMHILATKKASVKLIKLLVIHGAKINDVSKDGFSPLIYASKGNNKSIIKYLLLECDADISVISNDGKTILSHAILNGSLHLTQYLIENKLVKDINYVDRNLDTPLIHAVRSKNDKLIEYLLINGVEVNSINNKEESAISIAFSDRLTDKSRRIIKLLINHKADLNRIYGFKERYGMYYEKNTLLIHSIKNNNMEYLKLLIDNGADVNGKNLKNNTPLYFSISYSHTEMTEYLLSKGANVNEIINDNNETALFYALSYGKFEIANLLIKNGADINHKNKDKRIPLYYTMYRKDMSDILINKNIDFEELDSGGKCLFHYCISRHNMIIFDFIMTNVPDININRKDSNNNTPLMLAVTANDIEIATRLLEKKPLINLRNNKLQSALSIAVNKRNYNMIKLLFDHGAKVDNSNIEINKNMLFSAVLSFRILKLLINNGFKINDYMINEPNYYGEMALNVAVTAGKIDSIVFLLKNGANPYLNNQSGVIPIQCISRGSLRGNVDKYKKVIECFEDNGIDIYAENKKGENVMFSLAGFYNYNIITSIIKYLLEEKQADVNCQNDEGTTLIMRLACKSNIHLSFFQYLVEERHCDINIEDNEGNNVLMYALNKSNFAIYDYFINKCDDFSHKNHQGTNLLMCAIKNVTLDCVKKLVEEKGVSISDVDQKGRSALFYLYQDIECVPSPFYRYSYYSRSNNFNILKYLIDQGIDLNIEDHEGKTVLFYITDERQVIYAIEHGADVSHQDHEGRTFLFYMTNFSIIKYAIEHGADASIRDKHGCTAISNVKSSSLIVYLAEHGADINDFRFYCTSDYNFHYNYTLDNMLKLCDLNFNFDSINNADTDTSDSVQETFLDFVLLSHHHYDTEKFVELLKKVIDKKLIDLHRKNFVGNTPLMDLMMCMCDRTLENENQYFDLLFYMIKNGANMEETNNEGYTPLYYAMICSSDLVKQFYMRGARILFLKGRKKRILNAKNVIQHEKASDSIKKDILQYLRIVQRINFNKKMGNSYPIFLAIEQKSYILVEYLLSKKVSLALTNKKDETVMDVAKRVGESSIINLISSNEEWIKAEKELQNRKRDDEKKNEEEKVQTDVKEEEGEEKHIMENTDDERHEDELQEEQSVSNNEEENKDDININDDADNGIEKKETKEESQECEGNIEINADKTITELFDMEEEEEEEMEKRNDEKKEMEEKEEKIDISIPSESKEVVEQNISTEKQNIISPTNDGNGNGNDPQDLPKEEKEEEEEVDELLSQNDSNEDSLDEYTEGTTALSTIESEDNGTVNSEKKKKKKKKNKKKKKKKSEACIVEEE